MPSSARASWDSTRSVELDRLEETHQAIRESRRGRQWRTEHMNFAIITRLAAEFQAFSRDLHDEAADVLIAGMGIANRDHQVVVRGALIKRKLDSGNASWDNLKKDFTNFGMFLDVELGRKHSTSKIGEWQRLLKSVNDARNAIAHSDELKIQKCKHDNPSGLTLRTARSWRRGLTQLAHGMDDAVGAYLYNTTGSRPW